MLMSDKHKFNTFSFCEKDYQEYYEYSHKREPNFTAMWEDISAFIRIALKNGYQIKITYDGMTVIIEYNYQDETLSGVSLEWLGEDEYIADAREEQDKCE